MDELFVGRCAIVEEVLLPRRASARSPTLRRARWALGMLRDSSRPTYVIFMTDGLPTFGETNEAKIAANARKANAQVVVRDFAPAA